MRMAHELEEDTGLQPPQAPAENEAAVGSQ
jgi:hypothetical protein